eukprot:m.740382 g.740382  ORF g.740382 m.740382 type:complete len:192 (+) comp23114_c1_seq4:192-767(+)
MFKQPLLLLGAFAVASNFPVSFGVVSTDVTDAFDHRFKGGWSESPPLKGQTAFERKHGILPGGVGFVYDHPGVNNHTVDSLVKELGASAATTDVQGAVCQQLQGLFVRPCESQYQYEGMNVTSYDTRYYSTSSTYELDRTYYIGGGAKYNFFVTVSSTLFTSECYPMHKYYDLLLLAITRVFESGAHTRTH